MTTRPSKDDAPVHFSAGLSAVIERLLKDPQRKALLTLGDVRNDVEKGGLQWSPNGELLYPQDRTSQLIELDDLIERYGAETRAVDLLARKAKIGP